MLGVCDDNHKHACFHARFLSEVANRLNEVTEELPLTNSPMDIKIIATMQSFNGRHILKLPNQVFFK